MVNVSRIAAIAAIVVIAAVAAACGATGYRDAKVTDSGSAAGTVAAETTTASDTSNAAATTGSSTVTVDLSKTSEFSMTSSVPSIPAGKVTFNVNNDGTMEHEMVAVKTDKTPQQLTEPDGTANESTSIGEVVVEAGQSGTVTLDMTPGKYILLCNLPGHYAGGMYVEFTVTASAVTPIAGVTDVSVPLSKTSEFSLTASAKSVPAGKTRFIVTNDGTMEHEMVVVKTDKTPQQLAEPDGTANESTSVGEVVVEAGQSGTVTLDLTPGKYILLCNLPGHYAAGMYTEFTVS